MSRSYTIYIYIVMLGVFLVVASGHAYAVDWDGGGIDAVYRAEMYAQRMYGNRAVTSIDVDDDRKWNVLYAERLSLSLSHATGGGIEVSGFIDVRHTDDRTLMIGDEHVRLLAGTVSVSGEGWSLELGDTAASFTNYTFNRGFFGVRGKYVHPSGLELILLGGVNRDGRLVRYERAFGGARLVAAPGPWATLAASYVHAEITKLFYDSTETAYRNDVFSIDGRFSFCDDRVVLAGEGAMSLYHNDMRNPRLETVRDTAVWAALSLEPVQDDLSLLFAYEYVEPGFRAVMGTHAVDRETAAAGFDYRPNDRWRCMGYWRFYRDGLTGASPVSFSTHHIETEWVVEYLPRIGTGGGRPGPVFTAGVYYLDARATDDPKSVDEETFRLTLGADCDREHTEYGIEYVYEHISNHITDGVDRENHAVECSWSHHHTAFGFDYRIGCAMSAGYEIQGGPYPTTDFKLGADVWGEVVCRRFSPYDTTLLVTCSGCVEDRRERANVRRGELFLMLSQVLVKKDGLTAWIALEYEATHDRASDGSDRYGERIGRMSINMEF
ncbi:MAG: hypothetical protein JW885_15770 [Deltaproteobacteria bacterium]|nr:hypothetical protein [Candidatus Zymogenaceae bacterium]